MTTHRQANQRSRSAIMRAAKRGFTLIELLIVIALLLIVMLMISSMFEAARDIYNVASKRNEVYSQGRLAINRIEADLMGILPIHDESTGAVTKDLILHSAEPNDWFDMKTYISAQSNRAGGADVGPVFQDTPFKITIGENDKAEKNSLSDIRPVISFKTRTKWWNSDLNQYDSGLAQVNYYLKVRKPYTIIGDSAKFTPGSAYLMRLVVPITDQTRLMPGESLEDRKPKTPREEDLCGSVLAMSVHFLNHASGVMNASGGQTSSTVYPGWSKADDRSSSATGHYTKKYRRQEGGGSSSTEEATLVNPIPGLSFEFGGNAGTLTSKNNEDLVVTVANYPAGIYIELTVADDDFFNGSVTDSTSKRLEGTVRVFRTVVALPAVEPASSLPKSERDKFKNAK